MILRIGVCAALSVCCTVARGEVGREDVANPVATFDRVGFKEEDASGLVRRWFSEKRAPDDLMLTFFEERARRSMGSTENQLFRAAADLRTKPELKKSLRDDLEKRLGAADDREKDAVLLLRIVNTEFSGARAKTLDAKLKLGFEEGLPWPICVWLRNCK
jgi:hypothetical protein